MSVIPGQPHGQQPPREDERLQDHQAGRRSLPRGTARQRQPARPPGRHAAPGVLLGAAGAVAVLGGIGGCGTAAGTASDTSAASPASPASAPARLPPGQRTVTYIVTGSPANITYGPAGSRLTATAPMHLTARLGTPIYYAINAQLDGSGSVTCEILVDGKVIDRHAAEGSHSIAGCEISPGPQAGQWRSDN